MGYQELSDKIVNDGGFSYSLLRETYVTEGFAVSQHPQFTLIVKPGEDLLKAVQFYGRARFEELYRADRVFGAWRDDETGFVYLDVVTVVPDKFEAIEIGRDVGEIAVFDLGSFEEVRIPYEIGDPDPTAAYVGAVKGQCDATSAPDGMGFACTWHAGHNAAHVAGDGDQICYVWAK